MVKALVFDAYGTLFDVRSVGSRCESAHFNGTYDHETKKANPNWIGLLLEHQTGAGQGGFPREIWGFLELAANRWPAYPTTSCSRFSLHCSHRKR